jgi:hypothetical protein
MFVIACQSEKKPPHFLLNARSHSDMTYDIPLFTEHHRTIDQIWVATHTSLRASISA